MLNTAGAISEQELAHSVTAAFEWLGKQSPLTTAERSSGLAGALDWLLATWTCERACGLKTDSLTTRSGAVQLADRLMELPRSQAFDQFFGCSAWRLALAHRIFTALGVVCPHLDIFIVGLAASLESGESASSDALTLFETRCALAGVTSKAPGLFSPLHRDDLPSLLELLQADDQMIQSLAIRIAAATAFGRAPDAVDPDASAVLAIAIAVWILHYARGYRLDRVALLIRSLVYLGARHEQQSRGALRFLLAQQHPAGNFGFFGPETARARAKAPSWDEVAGLFLPMTFACLWAICEWANPSFRLMKDVE